MELKSVKEFVLHHKIVTICRKIYGKDLELLIKALCNGGIRLVEVTFDQADNDCIKKTSQAIEMLTEKFGTEMKIGAGTVITKEQVKSAQKAGASYIISPNADRSIIEYTKELGLCSMPGTMTPTEMQNAHIWGADLVKVFPAGWLGLQYIKDVRVPLNHISFVAAGGVTEENIKDYATAGYAGFGISGRLTEAKLIQEGNFEEFTRRAQNFTSRVS